MKIATYNVNGINGRLPVLLRWLEERQPEVVVLQELKAPQEKFPETAIRDLGYDAIWHGQKSWNGVAMLSRVGEIHETRRGLPGDPDSAQSRYIEAVVNGLLIGGLYLPNGNPRPGPKFDYKLQWLDKLIEHAAGLLESGLPVMLAGDFNVMPTERDVYKPERWLDDALFAPEVRDAFFRLTGQGWTDTLRAIHPTKRSIPSGTISGTPMAATPGFGSITCCSAPRLRTGWSMRRSICMCAAGKRPAIMRRSGSSLPTRRSGSATHEQQAAPACRHRADGSEAGGGASDGGRLAARAQWDGFRAIASRLGGHVELRSKSGKSLARYFPEIVAALMGTGCKDYVLDGELILPIDGVLSFDALQARLHPAESRILRLSGETPAQLMLFDCLALESASLIDMPLAERRAALERFHVREGSATLLLSSHAPDLAGAQAWLAASGGARWTG